jgi:hypothetical protein
MKLLPPKVIAFALLVAPAEAAFQSVPAVDFLA